MSYNLNNGRVESIIKIKNKNKFMKNKIFIALVFAIALTLSTGTALASTGTSTPVIGGSNPAWITQTWNLTGENTPTINSGQGTCPAWYRSGCYDLTSTRWYANQMKAIARQLIEQGRAQDFPRYSFWYTLVR